MGESLTLVSEPLREPIELTGPLAASLLVESSTADADVFVTLRAFGPGDAEVDFQGALDPRTPLAQGWLRASHRKLDPARSTPFRPYHTHDELQKLEPGSTYRLEVELWPTCILLPAGARIAVTIGGTDFARAPDQPVEGPPVSAARVRSSTPTRRTVPPRSSTAPPHSTAERTTRRATCCCP